MASSIDATMKKEICDRYWKKYSFTQKSTGFGYFESRFSDCVPIGRICQISKNPNNWEAIFELNPDDTQYFNSYADAKKFIEDSYLIWVLDGGSLAPYFNKFKS